MKTMPKKKLYTLFVLLAFFAIAFGTIIAFFVSPASTDMSGTTEGSSYMNIQTSPSSDIEATQEETIQQGGYDEPLVGNDKDEHGCIGSAGYVWSESKQACIRPWEQTEQEEPLVGGQRDEHGCLGPAGYSWSEDVQACFRSWELDESQRQAAKIAVAYLGPTYGETITAVETLRCPGCFTVTIQKNDQTSIVSLNDWIVQ